MRDPSPDLRSLHRKTGSNAQLQLSAGIELDSDDPLIREATTRTFDPRLALRVKNPRGVLALPLPGLFNKRFSAGLRAARCAHSRAVAAKTLLR